MSWFNAALYWIKCTVRQHFIQHKPIASDNSSTLAKTKRQHFYLQTENNDRRPTDTRMHFSIDLSITVTTHHQRLSELLVKMQQATEDNKKYH